MADPKLPQKPLRENPFKRIVTRLVLLAFLNQNLAFATNIELDFKDSQTPQRLHTILPSYKIADVSHVEIDLEKQQVVIHKLNKTDEIEPYNDIVPISPVIIPNHDVQNLPWDLEPEKLTLFILNHTAWLSPLDEDGYKLEFRGQLLGGMKKSGGETYPYTINVYPGGVDCGGRNDWPKGTIGDKYCRNNGNGLGDFGVQVFNKPYVPPVDKEWQKHCEKACNPFGNQKAPYIPPREDKKPDLKKVSINPVKTPQIKVDDKKIHQAIGKEVREGAQPLINKFDKYQVRGVVQKIPDLVMETLASYQGGEISQKTLDEIVRNIGLRIDPMMKQTGLFRILNPNDYYRILDKDRRWCGKSVDEVSRKAVAQAYAGLKKQYAEELEKFKKKKKIEEERLEKERQEQVRKEELIRLEQERIKIEKMTVPDEYDRHYIEKYLLPILQQIHTSPAYKSYDAFISNKGTGYRVGMNLNDYWQQSWLDSKKNGEAARKFSLPFYERPSHVMTQTDYDRLYLEIAILPTIRKFNSHPAYKDYQTFINNPGTGYKVGMNPEDYWQSWLNSEKWGEAARQNPLTSKYHIPPHSIRDTETYDRQFIETTLLPVMRKYTSHPAYQDYRSFINSTGTGYKKGDTIQDYMNLQSWKTWKGGGIVKDFPKYEVPDTCNPFYGDYEKLKRLQHFINTTAWEGVYNYAELEGFSKEDVQYVESRRKETITFDGYMKEVFDDQVLEDWGSKDWREVFRPEEDEPQIMQVNLIKKIYDGYKLGAQYGPKGLKLLKDSWQKAVQAYKGEIVKGLKIDKETLNKIPKEFGEAKISRNGRGLRWEKDNGNHIRISKGNPNADFPPQRVDHARITINGKVIKRDGTGITADQFGVKTKQNADVHIPLEELAAILEKLIK